MLFVLKGRYIQQKKIKAATFSKEELSLNTKIRKESNLVTAK